MNILVADESYFIRIDWKMMQLIKSWTVWKRVREAGAGSAAGVVGHWAASGEQVKCVHDCYCPTQTSSTKSNVRVILNLQYFGGKEGSNMLPNNVSKLFTKTLKTKWGHEIDQYVKVLP